MSGEDPFESAFGSPVPSENVEPVWDESSPPVMPAAPPPSPIAPAAPVVASIVPPPAAIAPAPAPTPPERPVATPAVTASPAADETTTPPEALGEDGGGGGGNGNCDGAPDPVFSQQLWEVQLLLDYLSGNSMRRLPDKTAAAAAGLDPDWIEEVCRITWPPSASKTVQADQEALLIRVKDYLNSMAAPANGASVAFTILVAQDEGDIRERRRWFSRRPAEPVVSPQDMARSRRSLARKAYPDLCGKSLRFRHNMSIIGMAVAAWLLVTCWFTWYLALGNIEVGQLAAAQTRLADLQVKVTAQTTSAPAFAARGSPGVPAAPAPGSTPAVGVSPPALPGVLYCDEPALLPPARDVNGRKLTVYASPTQADLCASLADAQKTTVAAEADLAGWLLWVRGHPDQSRRAARASAWISTLANSVLPICYGLLGAAAAVLRLLSKRVRTSLLTPRDMTLSLQQLALGAVVGACIGLFVATPGDAASASALLGTAKLSGSALSFVAGFGVDAVFGALEALIARLFATAPAAAAPAR